MTTTLELVRNYLGVSDTNVISDASINIFIAQATDEDPSDGDSYCIALKACSILVQSALWQKVTNEESGLTIDTADVFNGLLAQRLSHLGISELLISSEDYSTP